MAKEKAPTYRVAHHLEFKTIKMSIDVPTYAGALNGNADCQKRIAMRYRNLVMNETKVDPGRIDYSDLRFTKVPDAGNPA